MKKPFIRNTAFLYALKIWLTSLALGPLGWYLAPHARDEILQHFYQFFYYASIFAFWYSWPCFLLLWLEIYVVKKRIWRLSIKRLVTSVVCLILALVALRVSFSDGFDGPRDFLYSVGIYVVALPVGVWLWKWPGREEGDRGGQTSE